LKLDFMGLIHPFNSPIFTETLYHMQNSACQKEVKRYLRGNTPLIIIGLATSLNTLSVLTQNSQQTHKEDTLCITTKSQTGDG
jgi:hypothetical protein